MSNDIIRSVGTIVKKEKLASIENATNSKVLILESLLPYPGYHGTTIPDKLEPESLFAVTKVVYQDEQIIRAIQKVKKMHKVTFDAVPGTIFLKNNPVNIIRFKDVGYNMISEIIKYFMDAGIAFEKVRKIAPYESIIRIRKFFTMHMLSEGIYEDMDVKEFFYLQVSKSPDWDTFDKITRNIRYNIEDLIFDGAQTSVYNAQGLVDFVRIYDRNRYIDKLSYIRKCYQDAYEKL